jgi:hypothetical protein
MEGLPSNSSPSATARISVDIYAQIVTAAQRRALEQLSEFARAGATDPRSNSRSNKRFFQCSKVRAGLGKLLRDLVELVGLVVANDGVPQIISLISLHWAAEFGPLRSNSNNPACPGVASRLHCAGRLGVGVRTMHVLTSLECNRFGRSCWRGGRYRVFRGAAVCVR